MSNFFIASKYAARVSEAAREIMGMSGCRWVGADGVIWELSQAGGGALIMPGIQGVFETPDMEVFSSSSQLPGRLQRGSRAKEKKVWWPVATYGDTPEQWQERDTAFYRGLQTDRPGRFWWAGVTNKWRYLDLNFLAVTDNPEKDPSKPGWAQYGLEFVANFPYWAPDESGRMSQIFTSSGATVFWPTDSKGFTVGRGFDLDSARVTNDGDVPAEPVVTVHGGVMSDVTITIDGATTVVPWTLPQGSWVAINTDQRAFDLEITPGVVTTIPPMTAIDNLGQDRTRDLGRFDPIEVPVGSNIAVDVTYTGTGAVGIHFDPRYRRPW